MIGDFYNIFENMRNNGIEIPKEILDILNQSLPSNLAYYKNDQGEYRVGPRKACLRDELIVNIGFDEQFVKEHLSGIDPQNWMEFIYRAQMQVPIKYAQIGNDEKQVSMEELLKGPFDENMSIRDPHLCPDEFPKARTVTLELETGECMMIAIRQVAHPSLEEVKFENENFKSLKLELYFADDQKKSRIKCTIIPQNAGTVEELIRSYQIAIGILGGTVKINGELMTRSEVARHENENTLLHQRMKMWTTVKMIEEKLGVSFKPAEQITEEVRVQLAHLECCLLQDKEVVWEHPFDHFHVNGVSMINGTIEDLLSKKNIRYVFWEGPIYMDLLGVKVEVYSHSIMENIVITNIEWDDSDRTSAEIYISDSVGSKWKLCRKYMTKRDAKAFNTTGIIEYVE